MQYTDETAQLIARELLSDLDADTGIAILCVPSVFIQLRNLLVSVLLSALQHGANDQATGDYGSPRVCLFEFDERFSVLEGFVKYDFNTPLALPGRSSG